MRMSPNGVNVVCQWRLLESFAPRTFLYLTDCEHSLQPEKLVVWESDSQNLMSCWELHYSESTIHQQASCTKYNTVRLTVKCRYMDVVHVCIPHTIISLWLLWELGLYTSTSLLPLEPTCTTQAILQFLYWSAVLKRYLHVRTHLEVREEALILKNVAFTWLAMHLPIHPSTRKVNVYVQFICSHQLYTEGYTVPTLGITYM